MLNKKNTRRKKGPQLPLNSTNEEPVAGLGPKAMSAQFQAEKTSITSGMQCGKQTVITERKEAEGEGATVGDKALQSQKPELGT